MKIFSKILVLLLIVAIVTACFTACESEDDDGFFDFIGIKNDGESSKGKTESDQTDEPSSDEPEKLPDGYVTDEDEPEKFGGINEVG